MTTTNVEVKVMPKPGTIIFVQGSSSMKDSLFGLTTSLEFFREHASTRMLERFEDHSSKPEWDMLIPVMVMKEDFSWVLRYCQRHHSKQFNSLIDEDSALSECFLRMRCFTHRDGSRYYAEFLDQCHYYLIFLFGKKSAEEYPYMKENPLEKKFVESLMKWKEENKPKPGSTVEVMQKTMELARDQLQNYRKPKEEIRSPGTTFP